MIDGALIVEIGMKCLVWMIAAAFLLAFIHSIVGLFRSVRGTDEDKESPSFYVMGIILAAVFMMIFSGLAIMPWWS